MQNSIPWRAVTGVIQRIASAASCSSSGMLPHCSGHLRTIDQQLWNAGPCSTSQRCEGWPSITPRSLHTSISQRAQAAESEKENGEDSEEVQPKPRVGVFSICCTNWPGLQPARPGVLAQGTAAVLPAGCIQQPAQPLLYLMCFVISENILCVSEHQASACKANRHTAPYLLPRHNLAGM